MLLDRSWLATVHDVSRGTHHVISPSRPSPAFHTASDKSWVWRPGNEAKIWSRAATSEGKHTGDSTVCCSGAFDTKWAPLSMCLPSDITACDQISQALPLHICIMQVRWEWAGSIIGVLSHELYPAQYPAPTVLITGTQSLPLQNPGFDFSGAEISGNYSGGGPQF